MKWTLSILLYGILLLVSRGAMALAATDDSEDASEQAAKTIIFQRLEMDADQRGRQALYRKELAKKTQQLDSVRRAPPPPAVVTSIQWSIQRALPFCIPFVLPVAGACLVFTLTRQALRARDREKLAIRRSSCGAAEDTSVFERRKKSVGPKESLQLFLARRASDHQPGKELVPANDSEPNQSDISSIIKPALKAVNRTKNLNRRVRVCLSKWRPGFKVLYPSRLNRYRYNVLQGVKKVRPSTYLPSTLQSSVMSPSWSSKRMAVVRYIRNNRIKSVRCVCVARQSQLIGLGFRIGFSTKISA